MPLEELTAMIHTSINSHMVIVLEAELLYYLPLGSAFLTVCNPHAKPMSAVVERQQAASTSPLCTAIGTGCCTRT